MPRFRRRVGVMLDIACPDAKPVRQTANSCHRSGLEPIIIAWPIANRTAGSQNASSVVFLMYYRPMGKDGFEDFFFCAGSLTGNSQDVLTLGKAGAVDSAYSRQIVALCDFQPISFGRRHGGGRHPRCFSFQSRERYAGLDI